MQGSVSPKDITKTFDKVKLEGRGVIAPTLPPTAAGETPTGLDNKPMGTGGLITRSPGGNFFMLAALGIGAYFYFNK